MITGKYLEKHLKTSKKIHINKRVIKYLTKRNLKYFNKNTVGILEEFINKLAKIESIIINKFS